MATNETEIPDNANHPSGGRDIPLFSPPDDDVEDENDLDGFIEEIDDDGFIEEMEDDVKANVFQAAQSSEQDVDVTPGSIANGIMPNEGSTQDMALNEQNEDDAGDDKVHRAVLDGNVIIIKQEPADHYVFPSGEESETLFNPSRRETAQFDDRRRHEPQQEGAVQGQGGNGSAATDTPLPPTTTSVPGRVQGLIPDQTTQQPEQPIRPIIQTGTTTPKPKKPRKRTPPGEKPYKCDMCDKSFSQTCSLLIHKRRHTGEKPYECSECGRRFYSRSNQTVHERTHTGERPYACSFCEKRFIQWSQLSQHLVIHTGEKMYKCKVCDKAFTQSGILNRHMYTHSGIKKFKCSECEKEFAHEANLTRHTRIHTGEKPFKCKLCLNSYAHNSSLNIHMKVHARKEAEAKARAAAEGTATSN